MLRLQPSYKLMLSGLGLIALSFVWGPFLIGVWLIVCYLGIIPIFLDKKIRPDLATVFVASCFGTMISGLFYVLSIRFGLLAIWSVPLTMLSLALYTLVRYRYQVVPVFDFRYRYKVFYLILFMTYGGLILVTSLKMGIGEYPPVFFNMDVPHLLAQAHQLSWTTIYPPESITTKGLVHAYHDGGPATVAAISHIARLPVHKVMFWVVTPLFLVGSYSAFVLLVHKLIDDPIKRLIGLIFFLPLVLLGSYLYNLFLGGDIGNSLIRDILGDSFSGSYDPESFGRGPLGLNDLAGVFLLGAAALLVVDRAPRRILVLTPIVACLIVFMKLDMAPGVYVFLGISVLLMWPLFRVSQFSVTYCLIGLFLLMVTPMLTMWLLGFFDSPSYIGVSTFPSFSKSVISKIPLQTEIEIAALVSAPVIIVWLFCRRSEQLVKAGCLVIATLAMMVVCSLLPTVIHIPKVGGQIHGALWLGVPLTCIGLISISQGRVRHVAYIYIAPLIVAALIAQWNRFHHMSVAIVLPEFVNEYADNRLLGEALAHIPRKISNLVAVSKDYEEYVERYADLMSAFEKVSGEITMAEWGKRHYDSYGENEGRILIPNTALLVTNDFRYLKYPSSSTQIPSLFGHQTYSVNIRHFVGPRGFNLYSWRLMNHQLQRLSRSFSKNDPQFAQETIRQANKSGWTHFILRKDVDDGLPPRNSDEIPLNKIYENDRYAVFEF